MTSSGIMESGSDRERDFAAGLIEDETTSWVPDAIGLSDLLGRGGDLVAEPLPALEAAWLDVPTAQGRRRVPLIETAARAWLHVAAERWLAGLEGQLAPGVFGYRDATTPYSDDYVRFMVVARRLAAEAPCAVRVDVEGFFASVRPETISQLPGIPPRLASAVAQIADRTGQALLPGHRWARRIANLVLMHVDGAVSSPFVRWQDDYWIFPASSSAAADVLAVVEGALAEIGLRPSAVKTAVVTQRDAVHRLDLPVAGPPDWAGVYPGNGAAVDLRRVKHTLRRLAERCDTAALGDVVALDREWPTLAPRIAMYVDALAALPEAAEAARALLETAGTEWRLARYLPLAIRQPAVADSLATEAVARASTSPVPAIRSLAYRLHAARGGAVPALDVPDRVRGWAVSESIDGLPRVVTRL